MFKNRFMFLNFIKSAFIYYVLFIFFTSLLFSKLLISGYYFSDPTTLELPHDEFLNPGF